jgi:hypothetical protein
MPPSPRELRLGDASMLNLNSDVLKNNLPLFILLPVMCSAVASMMSVLLWKHGAELFITGDFGPMARSIRRAGAVLQDG